MNHLTAAKIVCWMARACGYVAKKREAYLEQTMVKET